MSSLPCNFWFHQLNWLFEFAQLFRSHMGIDPDAHIDLHELGMELCSEAPEETVTSEEAQDLFDKAASKFQEVAALAFFNWGNIHMCAARKRIPLDDSSEKEKVAEQLQVAYDWVKEKYLLASKKEELMRRRKKKGGAIEGETSVVGSHGEISAEEAAEQATGMRSHIHLFWLICMLDIILHSEV